MDQKTEDSINLIINEWWRRFCKRFEKNFFENSIISPKECYRFFGLHCGLTRKQSQIVLKILKTREQITRNRAGWKIKVQTVKNV